MNDLLNKVWKEYTDAMMNGSADVEDRWKTYQAVLEQFIRSLERSNS